MEEGANSMRSAVALAFIAGTLALAPGQASPMPLALGDHAALSRYMNGAVMQVSHRHVYAQRHRAAPLQLAVLSLLAGLISITTGSITIRMAVRCSKRPASARRQVLHRYRRYGYYPYRGYYW